MSLMAWSGVVGTEEPSGAVTVQLGVSVPELMMSRMLRSVIGTVVAPSTGMVLDSMAVAARNTCTPPQIVAASVTRERTSPMKKIHLPAVRIPLRRVGTGVLGP
jgi:hypothetical protein